MLRVEFAAYTRRVEFESHGLTQVKLEHRNVCKDGFGDATDIEGGKSDTADC